MSDFTEVKWRLDGSVARYDCELVHRAPGHAVIRHVLVDTAGQVMEVQLPKGTVTFGYYWAERLYNVYHWLLPGGGTAGYYFNLADRTEIGADYVAWRDLIIDVLVTPDGRCRVLDEEELPDDLEPALRVRIEQAKSTVLAEQAQLVRRIKAQSSQFLRET